jgi:hypothetical protein
MLLVWGFGQQSAVKVGQNSVVLLLCQYALNLEYTSAAFDLIQALEVSKDIPEIPAQPINFRILHVSAPQERSLSAFLPLLPEARSISWYLL